jgi:hypothetical protein
MTSHKLRVYQRKSRRIQKVEKARAALRREGKR